MHDDCAGWKREDEGYSVNCCYSCANTATMSALSSFGVPTTVLLQWHHLREGHREGERIPESDWHTRRTDRNDQKTRRHTEIRPEFLSECSVVLDQVSHGHKPLNHLLIYSSRLWNILHLWRVWSTHLDFYKVWTSDFKKVKKKKFSSCVCVCMCVCSLTHLGFFRFYDSPHRLLHQQNLQRSRGRQTGRMEEGWGKTK